MSSRYPSLVRIHLQQTTLNLLQYGLRFPLHLNHPLVGLMPPVRLPDGRSRVTIDPSLVEEEAHLVVVHLRRLGEGEAELQRLFKNINLPPMRCNDVGRSCWMNRLYRIFPNPVRKEHEIPWSFETSTTFVDVIELRRPLLSLSISTRYLNQPMRRPQAVEPVKRSYFLSIVSSLFDFLYFYTLASLDAFLMGCSQLSLFWLFNFVIKL